MAIDRAYIEKRVSFLEGVLSGIHQYAWWKDGTEYVGTTGKTYKDAIEPYQEELKRLQKEIMHG